MTTDQTQDMQTTTVVAGHAIDDIVRFHGHMCPGLAMGVRAAEIALREIGPHCSDEEVVALVETDMCALDPIQYLTGCTLGKGNLIHLDHGKNVYTFIRRSDGRAIRIATRPQASAIDPQQRELFARVRAGDAGDDERATFQRLHLARSQAILRAPEDELYTVTELEHAQIPPPARIHGSVACADCGEMTMETRIRIFDGRQLCLPCFERASSS